MTDPGWLPNLFLAGVPKAGTSALHRWLADHPDVCGARDKEARFFVDRDSHLFRAGHHVDDGWDAYRQQFGFADGNRPPVVLDSTPGYIYQATALAQIPDLPSTPKCLFVVREPADQIRSLFTYFQSNWAYIPAQYALSDFVAAVEAGSDDFGGNELAANALRNAAYVDALGPWHARLGPDRMKVVTFDALRRDPAALCREVAQWLNIDPDFYDSYAFPAENESYTPRSRGLQRLNIAVRDKLPKGVVYRAARWLYRALNTTQGKARVEAETMDALRNRYREANRKLAAAFDLDLSDWPM